MKTHRKLHITAGVAFACAVVVGIGGAVAGVEATSAIALVLLIAGGLAFIAGWIAALRDVIAAMPPEQREQMYDALELPARVLRQVPGVPKGAGVAAKAARLGVIALGVIALAIGAWGWWDDLPEFSVAFTAAAALGVVVLGSELAALLRARSK